MQPPPYQQLAKEFMDLWQKQVSTVVSDKQFIHAMLEMFQSMQMPEYDRKSKASTTSKPADAPDAGHELLAEFAFRLAMCEKRLAALEKQREKGVKKPKSSSRSPAKGSGRGSKKPRK
jgi:hypothetical protein